MHGSYSLPLYFTTGMSRHRKKKFYGEIIILSYFITLSNYQRRMEEYKIFEQNNLRHVLYALFSNSKMSKILFGMLIVCNEIYALHIYLAKFENF